MLRHAFLLLPLIAMADVRSAHACGGCFHGEPPPNTPPSEVASVVTDHRMAISISTTQTVLWDQVQYAGDPKEFAWVLPVRQGARLQLSHDEWLGALDASTRTTVVGPPPKRCSGFSSASAESSGGGGGGCGAMSMASSADYGGGSEVMDASGGHDSGVDVVRQEVVGPYEVVTLRASEQGKIDAWLRDNGFVIPESIQPILDRYTQEGFDFIALRLRPGRGVRAMRPVRVVTPGADATLPLRMVAAGIGQSVGLTLFVITEGRYRPQNFPEGVVARDAVTWDARMSRSNYTTLARSVLLENDGRTWLAEHAMPIDARDPLRVYSFSCRQGPGYEVPCASDGGVSDAGTDADAEASAPRCFQRDTPCDDDAVALTGLHRSDVWVTKIRADLPARALDVDLRLEPHPGQTALASVITTNKLADPTFDPCPQAQNDPPPSPSSDSSGCACDTARTSSSGPLVFVGALAGVLAFALIRRRR